MKNPSNGKSMITINISPGNVSTVIKGLILIWFWKKQNRLALLLGYMNYMCWSLRENISVLKKSPEEIAGKFVSDGDFSYNKWKWLRGEIDAVNFNSAGLIRKGTIYKVRLNFPHLQVKNKLFFTRGITIHALKSKNKAKKIYRAARN